MKRHVCWSNCRSIRCFDRGVMAKAFQEKHFKHAAKSAKTYTNKAGKQAYHGTRFLKGTQILGTSFIVCSLLSTNLYHNHLSIGTCLIFEGRACLRKSLSIFLKGAKPLLP